MTIRLIRIGWALYIGIGVLVVSIVSVVRVVGRPSVLRLMRRILAVSWRCVPKISATPALMGTLGVAVQLVVVLMGAVFGWGSHPAGAVHRLGAATAATASNKARALFSYGGEGRLDETERTSN